MSTIQDENRRWNRIQLIYSIKFEIFNIDDLNNILSLINITLKKL